ncbi:MAG: M28 family peptidase [Planctomycetota bacterium]|nr:M28 family peptidase [Planctomycetota bacterium]
MRILPVAVVAVSMCACRTEMSNAELVELSAAAAAAPKIQPAAHRGPPVAPGATGTARFASKIHAAFSAEAAFEVTTFADRWYRAPGNEGFEATLTELERRLRAAGFGAQDGLELRVIETPMRSPAWTPRSARLALVRDGVEEVLHEFSATGDRDRTMLPTGAPSADVGGRLVTRVEDCAPGTVLLLDSGLRPDVLRAAAAKGAVLAIASDLAAYNVDPTGRDRHRDAIGFRSVRAPVPLAVAQVSPRAAETLRAAAGKANTVVRFTAVVETAERPLRTLVATVVGRREPQSAVPIVAHVQEPGACDNASGVGTVLECALAFARLLGNGSLTAPARSVAFVFGDEMEQSRVWLEHSGRTAVAAIAADMVGESRVETGAEPLLERAPDPGALEPLPPDVHTAWGAGSVSESDLRPDGLAVVLREALADVALVAGPWQTAEHPFEGGSDHVVFLDAGIPSALLWHFPDWSYHTSADRLELVDPAEMRRSGAVLLAAALAVADAQPADLDRHLRSAKLEIDMRVGAAKAASDEKLADQWRVHGDAVRQWLRELCLGTGARIEKAPEKKAGGGS